VLESDEKWSSQFVKGLQIVISNVKLLILVTLTNVLRALVNENLTKYNRQDLLSETI